VVAIVNVEQVNEKVNLYRDTGNIFQSIKKLSFATLAPPPISECKIKLNISPFIVYNNKLDIIFLIFNY
jgi:hypothetical protein